MSLWTTPKKRFYSYTPAVSSNPSSPPALQTAVPGPRSLALAKRLAEVECPNVTCLDPEKPIFWERAQGANVWDVDGNRFVDLGAAFGVANVGHSHPRVVASIADQASRLLHGMGDVHPAAVKVELLEKLTQRFPGEVPAMGTLLTSGSDAVETALRTAFLATGHPGVIAFEGAYHGLSLGTLDTTWRKDFREPFAPLLPQRTSFAKYGDLEDVKRVATNATIPTGAILIEPIQGRGGERVSPKGFLPALRTLCDEQGWLLIADEIYTGCGRTGRFFACEHESVVPDLLCVGKGLSSGMPISACLGQRRWMEAWPTSRGEALSTQTYIGHPAGCAAALSCLAILDDEKLIARSAELGAATQVRLATKLGGVANVRGKGLMLGIECANSQIAQQACRAALSRGIILLPSGDDGRVLSITPPLCIEVDLLNSALEEICQILQENPE